MEQEEELDDILDTAFDLYEGDEPFETIKPKQNKGELRRLARLVENEVSPRTVLEIGTADGGSLYTWARHFDDAETIISVDKDHTELHCKFLKAFKPGHIVCLTGKSQNAEIKRKVEKTVGSTGIDFILIDGGKRREEVRQDYKKYRSLVNDGGVIAFHDILTHQKLGKDPDVLSVWQEVREDTDANSWELMKDHENEEYGYGILEF